MDVLADADTPTFTLAGTPAASKPTFSFGTGAASTTTPAAAASSTPSFSFGAAPASQQQQQQSKPSLFSGFGAGASTGSPGQQQQAGAAPSFSLFGNNSNNSSQQAQQTTTGSTPSFSLFGSAGQNNQQQQQPAAGTSSFGGFGGGASSSGGFKGFGQTSTAPAQQQQQGTGGFGGGLSLFGSAGAQQQQQQQQQPQQNAQSLFSSANRPNPLTVSQLFPNAGSSTNTFSSSTNAPGASGFGASQFGQSMMQGQPASQPPQPSLEDRIMAVKNAWDPNSPSNRFSYFFYNLSPSGPLAVPLTSLPLPPNVAASPHLAQLYKQAVLESPRPDVFLPTLASSMDDLQKRAAAQKQMAQAHLSKLGGDEVRGRIQAGNKKHWSETTVRVERLNREQIRLEERLVRLCARLAGLQIGSSPSAGAAPPSKDDSDLLLMLERIQAELAGGARNRQQQQHTRGGDASGARLAGVVNELWMVVSQRKAMLQGRSGTPGSADGAVSSAEWGVVDESEMQKVLEVGRLSRVCCLQSCKS